MLTSVRSIFGVDGSPDSPIELPDDFFIAHKAMIQVFIFNWESWTIYGTAPEANADRSLSSKPGDGRDEFMTSLGSNIVGLEGCIYFTGADDILLQDAAQSLLGAGCPVVHLYRFDKEERILFKLADIKESSE